MAWINHREPTVMEVRTFGPNCRVSPLTDRVLEDGFGALPDEAQEWWQIRAIEFEGNKKLADELSKKWTDRKNLKTAKASMAAATETAKADGLSVQ
jgi:hypothetical protein